MKKQFLWLIAGILALTSCVEVDTTITVKKDLPTSIELLMASPFSASNQSAPRIREPWGSDGYIEYSDHPPESKEASLKEGEMFIKIPSEAHGSYSHFNKMVDGFNGSDNESSKMLLPRASSKKLIFDYADLYDVMKDSMHDNNGMTLAMMNMVLSSATWRYTFISEDGSTVKDVQYLDRRDRWISCVKESESGNKSVYLLPMQDLFVGNIKQVQVIFN